MTRRMVTTNEELFHKNYGNLRAETTAINLFARTFKINQDNRMDMRTIYRQDFPKFDQDTNEKVTRQLYEKKNQKLIKQKVPMQTQSQSMVDFVYDKKEFQKALSMNKKFYADLFRPSLPVEYYQHMKHIRQSGRLSDISEEKENDLEDELRSKSQFNFGINSYKNFRTKVYYFFSIKEKCLKSRNFIYFFKNKLFEKLDMLPDLRVIKKLPAGQFNTKKVIPPIPSRRQFLSSSLNDLNTGSSADEEEQGSSSYR